MNYAFIYDIILAAIVLISAFVMSGKGLFKLLYKVASIVVTVIVVTSCASNVAEFIESSPIGNKISQSVEAYVVGNQSTMDDEIAVMPEFMAKSFTDIKTNAIAPAITDIVISILSALCIYLIVKLVLYILFFFIQGLFKLPVLKQVNRLAGICVGAISGFIIIYILCALMSLNITNSEEIREIVDNTYLVKHFYDNNLLITFFI